MVKVKERSVFILDKGNFIDILTSMTPQEINDLIMKNGKIKPIVPFRIIEERKEETKK